MRLMLIRNLPGIFKDAVKGSVDHDIPAMASALAYHAILSLAPLLIVILGAVSMIFGADAVESEVVEVLKESVGPKAAAAIQSVINSTRQSTRESWAIGSSSVILLVIFSTGVFKQLIGSLNSIWGLDSTARRGVRGGLLRMIRRHLLAFLMLIALGLWLYVSLLVKTLTVIPDKLFLESFPEVARFWPHIPEILAPVVLTMLFAVLFKFLPDARIRWHDVWFGAAVTAVLLVISEKVIAYYLQKTIVTSLYGAAGSLIILLLWVYWTAVVFLFGAESARSYTERLGSRSAR